MHYWVYDDDDDDDDDDDGGGGGGGAQTPTTVTAALRALGRRGDALGYSKRKLVGGLFFGWNCLNSSFPDGPLERAVIAVGDAVRPVMRAPGAAGF